MESRTRRQFLFFSLVNVFSMLSPVVGAEPDRSLEQLLAMPLEELVEVRIDVASHFVESPLSSGSTVSVINESQWKKRGARTLTDALGQVPGTVVLPNWFGSQQILIRGYADGNNSGGVATFWDGVPISSVEGSPQFNRQFINLGTLDRIELMRGPGSALHGENAFHGVFDIHSFQSDKDITQFNTNLASNGFYQVDVRHSQSIGQGIRVNATAAQSAQPDQHRSYVYYEPFGTSERAYQFQSRTAVIQINSSSHEKLSWSGGINYDNIGADGFLSAGTSGASGLDNRDTGGVDSSIKIVRGRVAYQFDNAQSFDGTAYYWIYDRTYKRNTSLTRDLLGTGGADEIGAQFVYKHQQLFGNTRASAALDVRRQRMLSARRKITDINAGIVVDEDLAFSNYMRTIVSASADADSGFFSDLLHLKLGGRIDQYSDVGILTTPRVGLIVHPTPKSAVKALYGEGFRAPNSLEVKGSATISGNPDIKPEKISSYELVYAYQAAALLAEASIFSSKWENAITNSSGTQYVNSGESNARGGELNFSMLLDPVTLELNGSYIRSKNLTTNQDYVGFPVWIFNGGLGYRVMKYNTDVFFNARVMLDASDGQYTSTYTNPNPLPKYLRGDVHIATEFIRHFTLSIDVGNVLNRMNRVPSLQINPSTGGIEDEERIIKLGITYHL